MVPFRTLVLKLVCLSVSASVCAADDPIAITPEWARQHPNALQISVGTAMSGRTDWTIRLRGVPQAEYRIETELSPKEKMTQREMLDTGPRVYLTHTYTKPESKTVIFGFTEFPPHEFNAKFRVQRVERNDRGSVDQIETRYVLRLSDFHDTYGEFTRESNRKRLRETWRQNQ